MARVESLRPGEVYASSLDAEPLPDLLLGILRANLTGVLELGLSGTRRNTICFRDGVPVVVIAPDLVEAGGGASPDRRTQAADALVSLFGRTGVTFRFQEGRSAPREASPTVLQPLPIIFSGLRQHPSHPSLQAFLATRATHRFRLNDTYPRGVDPFEWGPRVERAVLALERPEGLPELMDRGLERAEAAAALVSLVCADMVEVLDPRVVDPAGRGASTSGLALPASSHVVRAALEQRLGPLHGETYFSILRVPVDSPLDELRGALRASLRRLDAMPPDAGRQGLRMLFGDVERLVTDPAALARYRAAVQTGDRVTRARLEAAPMFARARAALAEGALAVAEYWLDWVAELEPQRRDLRVYRELVGLLGASPEDRATVAQSSARSLENKLLELGPDDPAQLARGLLLAALGEVDRGATLLAGLGADDFLPTIDRWRAQGAAEREPR